jgi:hypothetical protein
MAESKQRPKVCVRRDDHSLLLLGPIEYLLVGGCLQAIVTNMHRVVPRSFEPLGDHWRERIVDQEPHAEAASGNSRSRTASAA